MLSAKKANATASVSIMTLSRSKCRPIGASPYSVELLMSKRQNGVLFHVGSLQLGDDHTCRHNQHAMRHLYELFGIGGRPKNAETILLRETLVSSGKGPCVRRRRPPPWAHPAATLANWMAVTASGQGLAFADFPRIDVPPGYPEATASRQASWLRYQKRVAPERGTQHESRQVRQSRQQDIIGARHRRKQTLLKPVRRGPGTRHLPSRASEAIALARAVHFVPARQERQRSARVANNSLRPEPVNP